LCVFPWIEECDTLDIVGIEIDEKISMIKENKTTDIFQMGRKSKYNPDTFPKQVLRFATEGLTEPQMAHNLGVSLATFSTYKNKFPDFLEALKEGKKPADFEIENALHKRAHGFVGPDGKYYPPDTTACIYWLGNRKRDKWKNVNRTEHTGRDGEPLIPVHTISDEEIEIRARAILKKRK